MIHCKKCRALLPKDSGFSDLCDGCLLLPPLEIIGGADKPKAEQAVLRRSDTGTVTIRPRKPRTEYQPILSAPMAKKLSEEFDLGIDENASYEELEEFRKKNSAELSNVKQQLYAFHDVERSLESDRRCVSLQKRRALLGERDQRLMKLIASKRPKGVPVTQIASNKLDNKMIANYALLRVFYNNAKKELSEDVFLRIEQMSISEIIDTAQSNQPKD